MTSFKSNVTLGDYKIGGLLGEGAMGRVYAGEKEGVGRVALKVPLSVEFEPMLEAEANALRRVSHPNIVPFVDWWQYNGSHALVMGFVEGDSLEERFTRQPLTADEVNHLAKRCGDALASAHRAGVIHRDLKPSNIVLRTDGEPILLDFGAASTPDTTSDPIGTLSYMSPEQVMGEESSPASDQFSFGVVLYEALAGRRPFSGYHSAALEYEICHEMQAPLSEVNSSVSPAVSDVIDRLLSKDPTGRFQTFDEFVVQWEEAQKVEGPGASLRRLVVAPAAFVNEMKDPELEYVSRGLGDAVALKLKSLEGLALVSPATMASQEKATGDRLAAAQAVGAELIVGGRFYKAGPQMQIICELVDVGSQETLWSDQYRGAVDAFFDIQDELAAAVERELREMLPDQPQPEVETVEHVPPAEALQLYRKARELYYRGGRENLDQAVEMCEHVLDLDPEFATAQAGLADCYINYYMWFIDRRPIWLDKGERAARRALEIDEHAAPAYRALGRVAHQRGDHEKAAEYYRRAIEIDPKYSEAMRSLGWLSSETRDFDSALHWAGEALKAQPGDEEASLLRGLTYLDQRNYAHAERAFRELVRLNPEYGRGHLYLGETLQKAGRFAEAKEAFLAATKCSDFDPEAYRNLGQIEIFLEQWEDARATFLRAIEEELFEFVAHYFLGLIAAVQGNRTAAKAAWENARVHCERTLTRAPDDEYSALFLGLAKAALGDRSGYDPIMKVRRGDSGSGEMAYFEARAAALLGDIERAEACVTEALLLPLGPSHAEYSADPHFSLAEATGQPT